ncbi:DUF881 domain-containing protein [Cellulomonas fengjieae]|uniref:DUF881 domain-containing protein n=1 Tax=Cellulomonas fengjieae TaxID=2819978 RepID=A0ABS3SIN6_9CELL|nr:DUF881 domain-containing protein [Cellulomonas fengjieae]MBO3085616.1 DUF881 domain-containing protein [Cellulomonas fengjieae]QVI67665.1 DUF881 domain-containing protein [Cellulomonas fengjieae]
MSVRHGSSEPPRSPDASMTLLTEVYRRPLDPGYAEAAQRRSSGTAPRRSVRATAVMVVLAIGLGLGATAATLALRRPTGSVLAARELLESQIGQRSAEADAMQSEITAMTDEIATLQEQLLGGEGQSVRDQIRADAVEAGVMPVAGPGLRVVLTDAPSDSPDEEDPSLRVQDVDLQVVVNGLWATGAEAIAVNGQRLTATTAIRSAGDAVLVDLVALGSPYTVDAIGDAVHMQTELARASAGQHLATLRSTFGIGVQLTSQSRLELTGSGMVTMREAQVPGAADDPEALGSGRAPQDGDVTGSARPTGRDGT